MSETHHTFCRICESLCGLQVTLENGKITRIRPDEDHVATRGFACIKGVKQQEMYGSPDRLQTPLKRTGTPEDPRFVPISWDQAIDEIGAGLKRLRADHGPDSIAMYVGTAAGFSLLHPIFAQGFMAGLGSKQIYASATQDCANKFAVARRIYGFPFVQPFPDLDHVQSLVVVGANPVMSKWSFLQVPNPYLTLHELTKRGGSLFIVDPRRTETAKVGGEHLFIRPDTDLFFFASFLNELFRIGRIDKAQAAKWATGVDTLEALVQPWTLERAEEVTQIPAQTMRRVVATWAAADGAAVYSSTGVNMGTQGALCFWLQEAINLLTGNLDRQGGLQLGEGVFDFAGFSQRNGLLVDRARSRIGGFERTNDAWPGGILADQILTPGEGQVRALVITGGNPLLTMPNSARLRDAMAKLELSVSLDIYLNESASMCTHVLPSTSPFQRPDLPFAFPLFMGMQKKPYVQATRALLSPEGEQRDESTIYHDLCRAAGIGLHGSKVLTGALEAWRRWARWRDPSLGPALPLEAILDLILRLTGQPRFDALLKQPHGVLRPPRQLGKFLGHAPTEDGLVHLDHPDLVASFRDRAQAHFDRERAPQSGFKLITKRQLTTHNSWTHNIEPFAKARTNHLHMHPEDAARLGISDGDLVDVTTGVATVRTSVELLEDLMPGVVALPHGWGHQHARGLSVASQTHGVNVNLLAADGPDALEPLSGMAHLTGIRVTVQPAAGPKVMTSWSGT